MRVEHHHHADELLREVAEFRRERCDESREVLLFVGAEAAGKVDPFHVTVVGAGGPNSLLGSSRDDLREVVAISEDVLRTTRRVFGTSHPNFISFRMGLENARMRLADDESRQAFTDAAPAPPTRRRRHRRRPK